jgi:hypothetical protein
LHASKFLIGPDGGSLSGGMDNEPPAFSGLPSDFENHRPKTWHEHPSFRVVTLLDIREMFAAIRAPLAPELKANNRPIGFPAQARQKLREPGHHLH